MKADKNHIRTIVSVQDILGAYGMRNDRSRIPCPLREHKRNDPPFAVKQDSWKCHACNEGGDIFKLVQLMNGCDFPAALDWICRQFNITNDDSTTPEQRREFAKALQARQKAEWERKAAKEYERYTAWRICHYVQWLFTQEQTAGVQSHIEWCRRITERINNGEFDFSTFNVDERLAGMWQQIGRDGD